MVHHFSRSNWDFFTRIVEELWHMFKGLLTRDWVVNQRRSRVNKQKQIMWSIGSCRHYEMISASQLE